MTQLDAVIPILPREAQVVHELAAVLVRILIRQGVAEGFAFPTPGQAFVERVVDRARGVEVVGVDVVDQRFAGIAAVGAHHRDRGIAQPDMILGRALRGGVGMFRQQVAGFVVDELDRFAIAGLDRQLPLRVVEEAGEALAVLQGVAQTAGVVVAEGDGAIAGLVAAGVQGISLGVAAALLQQAVAGRVDTVAGGGGVDLALGAVAVSVVLVLLGDGAAGGLVQPVQCVVVVALVELAGLVVDLRGQLVGGVPSVAFAVQAAVLQQVELPVQVGVAVVGVATGPAPALDAAEWLVLDVAD